MQNGDGNGQDPKGVDLWLAAEEGSAQTLI
jgi:hypothetical protein